MNAQLGGTGSSLGVPTSRENAAAAGMLVAGSYARMAVPADSMWALWPLAGSPAPLAVSAGPAAAAGEAARGLLGPSIGEEGRWESLQGQGPAAGTGAASPALGLGGSQAQGLGLRFAVAGT